jgi:S-DNA-T family DNA segregation ATPase FtsK/SpoIIIE
VDGIGAFRETYEHVTHSAHFALFSQLISDGRMLGIHVVVTGDRPGALSTALSSTIQRRLVLRLASDDDYGLAGVPGDILSSTSPPGRGIMDGQEMQVAVLGGDANVAVQGRAVEQLANTLQDKGITAPEPIERLPEQIPLDSLPTVVAPGAAAFALADDTLAPIGLTPRGVLMVTGPPGSGRSTTLVTLATAVRRANPGAQVIYLAPGPAAATTAAVWTRTVIGAPAVAEFANDLMFRLDGAGPARDLMVVIEAVADFGGTEAENDLTRLVKTLADASAFVVGESGVASWSQAWQLGQPFKSSRRGIVLAPDGTDVDNLLGTPMGFVRRSEFPPGRGVLVEKGKAVWLQVAQPVAR